MFNNHEHCDESWCYVLKATKKNKQFRLDDNKPLFGKQENLKQYNQLSNAVARFQEDENIKDCLHTYDTQINESLCPKV